MFVHLYCRTSENYVLYYYVKPYTRYGPFLIGILIGIYLTTKKDQLLKQKVRTSDIITSPSLYSSFVILSSQTDLYAYKPLSCHHTYVRLAVVSVAGSTWLVLLSVSHGCVGWIGLHPQGDPSLSISATCPLPGATQTALGSGCNLDHTGL